MFKANNKDTRTKSLASSGIFLINFEHISHLILVFLPFTLSRQAPVNFTKVLHSTLRIPPQHKFHRNTTTFVVDLHCTTFSTFAQIYITNSLSHIFITSSLCFQEAIAALATITISRSDLNAYCISSKKRRRRSLNLGTVRCGVY